MALDWTTRGPGYPTNENASPAVANGVVYIGLNELQVFDAGGKVGCSGSPKTCTPLWTEHSTIGGSPSPPTVANGVVYVADGYDTLFAFDAAGKTNCSGAPKICAPLWTASGASSDSPAVANGKVYVGESVFDAAGKTNCSSSSKTCAPLWVNSIYGQSTTTPAVANGVVYMGTRDGLFAFDAAGKHKLLGEPQDVRAVMDCRHGRDDAFVTGARQPGRLHRFRRPQALRVRRRREHQLLRQPENLCSLVDRSHLRHRVLVTGGRQRGGLRRV
jgi:hypothetical protein